MPFVVPRVLGSALCARGRHGVSLLLVAATVMVPRLAAATPRADAEIAQLQIRLAAVPTDATAAARLAYAYIQKVRETGDPSFYVKAGELSARATHLAPDAEETLLTAGTLALSCHAFAEGLALGQRGRALYPAAAPFCGIVADACIELGRYTDAAATLDTMMTLRPDLSSYARVSYLRELHGDVSGALDAMAQAQTSGSSVPENVAWCAVQTGGLALGSGRLDDAARAFAYAHHVLPRYAPAMGGLARVALARGDAAAAESLYRAANDILPLAENLIGLGELLEVSGRGAEAARQYALVRAVIQLQRAAGVDADIEFALFAADHPRPPATGAVVGRRKSGNRGNLADSGDRGDPVALVAQARAARDRRPSVKSDDVLAWTQYRAGEFAAADSASCRALRLGTEDALMYYHAGMIAAAQGDTTRAALALHHALALSPRFTACGARDARARLAQLRPDNVARGEGGR